MQIQIHNTGINRLIYLRNKLFLFCIAKFFLHVGGLVFVIESPTCKGKVLRPDIQDPFFSNRFS
jgi:hypothetical protein